MKSVEANEAGETMRVKLAAAEAERDTLRSTVHGLSVQIEEGGKEERALREIMRRLVDGIDNWNASVEPIIGRPVDYWWPALEEARAAIAPEVKPEHRKHPSGDYCVWCRAQWPCEEAEVTP